MLCNVAVPVALLVPELCPGRGLAGTVSCHWLLEELPSGKSAWFKLVLMRGGLNDTVPLFFQGYIYIYIYICMSMYMYMTIHFLSDSWATFGLADYTPTALDAGAGIEPRLGAMIAGTLEEWVSVQIGHIMFWWQGLFCPCGWGSSDAFLYFTAISKCSLSHCSQHFSLLESTFLQAFVFCEVSSSSSYFDLQEK